MSEVHAATGPYSTDALDQSELEEFEAHLAVCPSCTREVAEFWETAAVLSLLAAAPAPPALKGSVMAAVSGVRVLPPVVPADDQTTPVAVAEDTTPVTVAVAASVDVLAVRRQRRLTRLLSLAVAAALVAALGLGGWVVLLTQRETPVATSTPETELLNAPDLKAYTVPLKNGGHATFVVSKTLNRALLSGEHLPPLTPTKTYQAWTLQGTQATRDSLISSGASVKRWFTGPVNASTAVAISVEPAGGSDQPTTILAVQSI